MLQPRLLSKTRYIATRAWVGEAKVFMSYFTRYFLYPVNSVEVSNAGRHQPRAV